MPFVWVTNHSTSYLFDLLLSQNFILFFFAFRFLDDVFVAAFMRLDVMPDFDSIKDWVFMFFSFVGVDIVN